MFDLSGGVRNSAKLYSTIPQEPFQTTGAPLGVCGQKWILALSVLDSTFEAQGEGLPR